MRGFLLARDHYTFIGFVTYSKGWTSASEVIVLIEIAARCWIFFHVSLHPIRKLLLSSKSESGPFGCIFLEATIKAIRRFSWIFRITIKSISFWHTISQDGLLQSSSTLFVKDTFIDIKIRSPKAWYIFPPTIEGKLIVYFDLFIASWSWRSAWLGIELLFLFVSGSTWL